nr:hypothetical protein [Tanacetum cinerariifolium]
MQEINLAQRTPHANHHVHSKLIQKDNISIYRCSGCKELVRGDRYVCQHCPYVHHLNCTGYKERDAHRFFDGCTFKFHQQRFDTKHRVCDACGLDINELFYHCEKKGLDLHPFCARRGLS